MFEDQFAQESKWLRSISVQLEIWSVRGDWVTKHWKSIRTCIRRNSWHRTQIECHRFVDLLSSEDKYKQRVWVMVDALGYPMFSKAQSYKIITLCAGKWHLVKRNNSNQPVIISLTVTAIILGNWINIFLSRKYKESKKNFTAETKVDWSKEKVLTELWTPNESLFVK